MRRDRAVSEWAWQIQHAYMLIRHVYASVTTTTDLYLRS